MKPLVTMREALADESLLGAAIPGDSWKPWRTLLIAAMGEELTDDERALFKALTGRESEPLEPVEEFWGVVGRRGGKTRAAGALAAYIAGLCDHRDYLASGERGALPILAATASQAGRAFRHAKGILEHSPVCAKEIDGTPTSDTIRLKTRVDIEVRPANYKTVRGVTAVAAVCDEVAFWMVEGSSNPDAEILNALRPALATTGGPLWVISSPYAKRGELYEAYRRDYGPKGDPQVLVAKGPSRTFNSTLPQRTVDRAYERDAAAAAAEYGGEFRNDIEAFISRETVEACVIPGLLVRPPADGVQYKAFVDPSGGASDAMTLAIGHREGDRVVVDLMLERKPPFSPEAVVGEFVETLKGYRVHEVTGDRYGGEWPREVFRRHGVTYRLADEHRSGLYQGLLPLLNSGRVELLDSPVLVLQIAGLERRVERGGREKIDHPPHSHDDLANVVAGVAGLCVRRREPPVALFGVYRSNTSPAQNGDLPPPHWMQHPETPDQAARARQYLASRASR